MIAPLYIALCGLVYVLLCFNVIKGRRQYHVIIGDGDNQDLLRRMRCQGNFAEYTPLFLILLYVAETMGLSALFINLFGMLYLIGRVSHAYGLLKAEKIVGDTIIGIQFRVTGMYITFGNILCLSLYMLYKYFS